MGFPSSKCYKKKKKFILQISEYYFRKETILVFRIYFHILLSVIKIEPCQSLKWWEKENINWKKNWTVQWKNWANQTKQKMKSNKKLTKFKRLNMERSHLPVRRWHVKSFSTSNDGNLIMITRLKNIFSLPVNKTR